MKTIILIGPNGSGKTSLAVQLMKLTSCDYYKYNINNDLRIEHEIGMIKRGYCVLDRSCIIDTAVYNDSSLKDTKVDFKCLHNSVIILLSTQYEPSEENHHYVTDKKLGLGDYESFLMKHNLDYYVFDGDLTKLITYLDVANY